MEWFHAARQNAEGSTQFVLCLVFLTNMLDNLLLTSVVPIIPSFLLHLDRKAFDEQTNQTAVFSLPANETKSSVPHENLAQHAFSLAAVASSENPRVGWLLSSKAIVQLVANPFVGPLCSRELVSARVFVTSMVVLNISVAHTHKNMLTTHYSFFKVLTLGYPILLFSGTTIIFISTIVFAVSQTFIPLLVARSLQGLGSAAAAISGMSLVAERYPDDRSRSKAMGVALGGAAMGILFGYPYGGFMYTFVGKMVPFVIIGALVLVDMGLQWFAFGLQPKEGASSTFTPLHVLLRDPYILVASGAVMFTTMSMAVLEPTVPLWIISTMHIEKWQLGLVFLPDSIGYLIGTNCFGLVARRIGRWICTMACIVLISLCLILLPFSTQIPHLILPHLGLGLGLGVTDAALMPLLALLVDARQDSFYGCVYAIVQLAVCLAYSVGPCVSGVVVKAVGFPWLMRGMGILNLLFCPFCILLRKAPVANDEEIHLSKTEPVPRYVDDKTMALNSAGSESCQAQNKMDDSSFSYGRLQEEE